MMVWYMRPRRNARFASTRRALIVCILLEVAIGRRQDLVGRDLVAMVVIRI